ncbi:reverse transcriptase domain-containing protein [Tanacetum coccineum]
MSLELADRSIQYLRGIVENVVIKVDKFFLPIDFMILDMLEDSVVPIILGRSFLATARAMIDAFNKNITLRVGDDEVIFDMDQSFKRSPAEDDEFYEGDDFCECEATNESDSIRRMEAINTPYSVAQKIVEPNKGEREQLYSASANEIDEKKPELKILPQQLEYAYLHGDKYVPIIISSKLFEKEEMFLYASIRKKIEVDRAKIDVIAKFPYPTNVKGLLMKDAKFDFFDDCKKAFNILKEKLTTVHIIISPDWNVPFELMCDAGDFTVGAIKQDAKPRLIRWVLLLQGFDIEIKDKKEAKNLAMDHLSRLENPNLGTFTEEEIADKFPNEHLMILKTELNKDKPWYADYVNYIVGKIVPLNWTPEKRRFFSQVKNYFWDEPYAFKLCPDNIMRRCVAGDEIREILAHCHSGPTRGHHNGYQLLEGKSMNRFF